MITKYATFSHFEEALRIKPGFTDGRYNLARILAAQGKQDEAIRLYSEALKRRPGFVRQRPAAQSLVRGTRSGVKRGGSRAIK